MYTQLDFVDAAERLAEAAALTDRLAYRPFLEAAERFAAESGLVVSGRSATRLLLGDPADPSAPPPVELDSFQCEFYSGAAPASAKALADALYRVDPDGLGHYASAVTKVPGQLLTVQVNGRLLFVVTGLPAHRGVRMADVLVPTRRPAQFARDSGGVPILLDCVGPELQLIGTYAGLTNPAKAESWGALLSEEAGLRSLHLREAAEKRAVVVARDLRAASLTPAGADLPARGDSADDGGGPASPAGGAETGEYEFRGGRDSRGGLARALESLRRALVDGFAVGPGRVLVGPEAVAILAGSGRRGLRVQVVSAHDLEREAAEIAAIAEQLGLAPDWTINDPKCPGDPRLRRLTLHVSKAGSREPAVDVFNAAAHELIPYVTVASWAAAKARVLPRLGAGDSPPLSSPEPSTLKIGTPFVLCRFRLVDSWTVQVLLRMGAISPEFARGTLAGMLDDYSAAADLYTDLLPAAATNPELVGECLLPCASAAGAAYVGRLENAELALRRIAARRPDVKYHPVYYAAASARGQGSTGGAESESEPAKNDAAWSYAMAPRDLEDLEAAAEDY